MNSTILANRNITKDRRLDCIPQYDERSMLFKVGYAIEPSLPIINKTWSCTTFLDQGQEGACVGFGFSHELAAEPMAIVNVTNERAFAMYHAAQRVDEWPGNRYEGTSVLAGAKACVEGKFFDSYLWATTVQEVAQALSHLGPVVIGVNWHEGMINTDQEGFIWPTGPIRGGHCVALLGVQTTIGSDFFVIGRNSWGRSWGFDGDFLLTETALKTLLAEAGSCFCVPVDRKEIGTWPDERMRRWWEFWRSRGK